MKFSIHDLTIDQLKKIQAALDDVFTYTSPCCPTSKCDADTDEMEVVAPVQVIDVVQPPVEATTPALTGRKPRAKKTPKPTLDDDAMLQLMMDLSDD